MDVNARAFWLQLKLVKVGRLTVGAAPALQDLSARYQGVVFRHGPELVLIFTDACIKPVVVWATRAENILSRFECIASFHLSVLGGPPQRLRLRATLPGLAHGPRGLLPEGTLVDLEAIATRLIHRDQGPNARDHRATGFPKRLRLGHPIGGGFAPT